MLSVNYLAMTVFSIVFALAVSPAAGSQMAERVKNVDPKAFVKRYVLAQANNAVRLGDESITQLELQRLLNWINYFKLGYPELMKVRDDLLAMTDLDPYLRAELVELFRDILRVENKMYHYRTFDRFKCRFALSDNPWIEVPQSSVMHNPQVVLNSFDRKVVEKLRTSRVTIGFCWDPSRLTKDQLQTLGFRD